MAIFCNHLLKNYEQKMLNVRLALKIFEKELKSGAWP